MIELLVLLLVLSPVILLEIYFRKTFGNWLCCFGHSWIFVEHIYRPDLLWCHVKYECSRPPCPLRKTEWEEHWEYKHEEKAWN